MLSEAASNNARRMASVCGQGHFILEHGQVSVIAWLELAFRREKSSFGIRRKPLVDTSSCTLADIIAQLDCACVRQSGDGKMGPTPHPEKAI